MNMTFHYAISCFEGMKAYKGVDGKIRLFRPEQNMARFNSSLNRLGLRGFEGEELIKCMEDLISLDKDYIPTSEGASLYIRPFGMAL